MEIHALKLLITEKDLNDAAGRHLPDDEEVRQVKIRLAPEGVYVSGVYRMLFNVAFETLWEPGVAGGKLVARLASFKALGIPMSLLKSMIMSAIKDTIGREQAFEIDEECVRLDVDRLLAAQELPLRTNLTAVRCQAGRLILEAAHPDGNSTG